MKNRLSNRLALVLILSISLVLSGCFASKAKKEKQAQSHFDLGISYYRNNDFTNALRALIEAEKLNPKDKQIQNALAMTYLKKKKHSEAEKHLKMAIELDPKFSDAYNNLGSIYMELGRLDEAKECFEKALDDVLYSTPENSLFNLGMLYYKHKVYYKAVEYFKQAQSANQRFALVRYYMGLSYMNMGRIKDACEHLCFVADNFPKGEFKSDASNYVSLLKCDCPSSEVQLE
jgi:type IV pilus assembly protein PilF